VSATSPSTWIRGAVTVAVLAYLATRIDLGQAAAAVMRLSPAVGLGVVVLIALDRAVMIWRWILLLRAVGQPVRAKSAAWIYLISSFVGSFTPAGIGADVARAYTLGRRTSQGHEAAASVVMDRMLGLLSILAVGAVTTWWLGPRFGLDERGLLAAASVLVIAGTIAFLFADALARAVLPRRWQASGIGRRLLRLADAVAAYRGQRPALAAVLLLSIAVQMLRTLQAYLLGIGIGIEVPLAYYFLFMPVALLTLLLPISQSGFGLPQAGIVWMLALQGVPEADAFALSLLIVLSGIVANLPGALLFFRAREFK
jgi:uncharacterized protein (TIRG00374 family)